MSHSIAHPLDVPAIGFTTIDTPWSDRYALRARGMTSSAIRELLKLIEDPGIISFAGGLEEGIRRLGAVVARQMRM